MSTRKYTNTRRAEQQEQTRERIVGAVMALHEKLGPANTSIKAIAEKAGVQRLTVYRYFPDDDSLFQACTSEWFKLHPPPDITEWADIEDAGRHSTAVLLAFYRYYRKTEKMWKGAYRDVEEIKALKKPMGMFEGYLDQVRDEMLKRWKAKGKRKQQLSTTLRHCLRFTSWESLKREKLNDQQITELVITWIQ